MPQTVTSSRTTPLPVSLAEAKIHLRVGGDELDSSINLALQSAVSYIEDRTGRVLRETETVVQSYHCWPAMPVRFDRQPVKTISTVAYYAYGDNSTTTLASTNYRLHQSTRGACHLEWDEDFTYPSLENREDAVQITYTAGYASLAVPAQAKWAILLTLEGIWGDLMPREKEANERSAEALISSIGWGWYR